MPRRTRLAAALALAVAAGCGGARQPWDTSAADISAEADASVFAGPAPLTVRFTHTVTASAGPVTFEWDLGDGTRSSEQNPTRTYTRPDFYVVLATATDARGHVSRTSLVLRAYPPAVWARARAGGLSISNAIRSSHIAFYRKYPESLPANLDAPFYRTYPYLRGLARKLQRVRAPRVRLAPVAD